MLALTYDVGNIWLDALLGLLAVVALMTVSTFMLIWLERKISARIQMRLGPMHVGPYGLLQTIADAVKLIGKEDLRPESANRWVFELAPFAVFVPTFAAFVAIPFTRDWAIAFLDLGLFYVVAVTGLSFVGFLMAGWASDNKYALLGGVRAAAQLMFENHIGAILVMDGGRLAGIFTERDALNRVLAEGRDPDSTPLSEVMTRAVA